MLIDWFTVGAQALNFFVLVWLMKRFLYKPILDAIDAREKRIAAELADAAARQAEATKERERFRQRNEEFDRQRADLLSKAAAAADTERERLVGEARKSTETWSDKRRKALLDEAGNLDRAIRSRTHLEVIAIARKTLADLAGTDLEARMVDVFILRLRAMGAETREKLAAALAGASAGALVRSAFELPAGQQAAIRNALDECFAADPGVRFETVPELISGIEITVNGQKLAWSIGDYLGSLAKAVDDLVNAGASPAAAGAPAADASLPATG